MVTVTGEHATPAVESRLLQQNLTLASESQVIDLAVGVEDAKCVVAVVTVNVVECVVGVEEVVGGAVDDVERAVVVEEIVASVEVRTVDELDGEAAGVELERVTVDEELELERVADEDEEVVDGAVDDIERVVTVEEVVAGVEVRTVDGVDEGAAAGVGLERVVVDEEELELERVADEAEELERGTELVAAETVEDGAELERTADEKLLVCALEDDDAARDDELAIELERTRVAWVLEGTTELERIVDEELIVCEFEDEDEDGTELERTADEELLVCELDDEAAAWDEELEDGDAAWDDELAAELDRTTENVTKLVEWALEGATELERIVDEEVLVCELDDDAASW
ncbi:hypothetical protein DFH09DRAFT_1304253 [Mycena vulgaris]|nr:hypothetical protein DFH09DRAFT_1304253 [Mycena vulgaris]